MGEKDKSQKNTKTPAAEMSRPFTLKNVELEYIEPKDVEVGTPDPNAPMQNPPVNNTKMVHKTLTSRWVYIFQNLGDKITWFAEYWLDEKGFVHPVDMKAARDKERNKRPAPPKEDDKQGGRMILAHTINGKRVYYAFYVGGTRLALESIRKLETPESFKKLFRSANGLDLKDDKSFRFEPPDSTEGPAAPYTAYILVFDALRYGMSVNRILQKVRDREVAWLVPAKNLEARQRERTVTRQKKHLIASTVKALLDGDPKDKLELKKKLKVAELNKWHADYEQKTNQKKADVRALAAEITGRLMNYETTARDGVSWTMKFAEESALILQKADPDGGAEDLARFMEEYAATIDRLIETQPGLDWLTRIVGDKSHFIHYAVMDTTSTARLYAQAFGRAPAAFFWIFKEVFIPYRAKYGTAFRKTMVNPLYGTIIAREFSVDLEPFQWTNKTGHTVTVTRDARIRVVYSDTFQRPPVGGRSGVDPLGQTQPDPHGVTQPGNRPPDPTITKGDPPAPPNKTVSYTIYEVGPQTVTTTHTPTNWSKNISEADVARIQKALKEFNQVLAALNMGLAMFDLGDKGLDTWRLLNAAAALGNTVVAFEVLTSLSEMSLRRIAFVTAIFDAVNSIHNALHAYDKGDKTGAAGFAITALGSAMVAAGIGLTIIGIETAWTGIGLVIAIIGALVTLFGGSNDTEIQLFVKHCIWGNSYGEDGGSDNWQEGRFENWHESKPGGLDRQIKAMTNLLRSFYITGRAWNVRIMLGMHDPKSKLQVKLENNYLGESHALEVVIAQEPKNRTGTKTRVVDPNVPDRRDTGGVSASYAGDYLDISWYFGGYKKGTIRQDDPKFEGDREMDVWVRLDLKGDGTEMIPPSGKWVKYHTLSLSERKPSRSLDN